MNARELRIGNYVRYIPDSADAVLLRGRSDIAQVTCFGLGDEFAPPQLWLKGRGFDMSLHDFDSVEPIPLTEELLLKCGGKLFPNGFGTKKIVFDLNIRLGFSIEFVTDRAGDVVIGAILNGNSTLVKFLHQLQNLFFALTGEELKVSI